MESSCEPLATHIRRRPGMYIGWLSQRGLSVILDRVVTELLSVPGSRPERVTCRLGTDGTIAVTLTGGSLPSVNPDDFVEPAGGIEDFRAFPVSLLIACALSDRLDVEIVQGDRRRSQSFGAGAPIGSVQGETLANDAPPFVSITYRPDPTVFQPGVKLDFLNLCGRAREWAAFHPQTRFTIENESDGQRRDYHYPDGLLSLASELEYQEFEVTCERKFWRCELTEGTTSAEVLLADCPEGSGMVYSFVNGRRTSGVGAHVEGLRSALSTLAARHPSEDPYSPFYRGRQDDPLDELTVFIAVRLENPDWHSTTKSRLRDARARDVVHRMIVEQLPGRVARSVRPKP